MQKLIIDQQCSLPRAGTWAAMGAGKTVATLTAIADTGSGSIMSTIFGQVTTTEKQCQFMPTIGSTVVP